METEMVTVGLFVRLKAKTGREAEVESFLKQALDAVDAEPDTIAWFALRFGPDTFGIFDAFPDESGRQAHLSGRVASALMERAPELLAESPTIERLDILAGKLPGVPVAVSATAGEAGDDR
jgi:quinol monooxygenase YgiN